jgi:leader peptidase (prepilin peptidase)/N-methyltransferase
LVTAYALLAVLPRSGLGFGDVKLAGLLGTALALLGWGALAWGTALAFLSGGLMAAALLVTGRAKRNTPLPFGPHMLAGALVAAVLFGSAGEGSAGEGSAGEGSAGEGLKQAVDVGHRVVEVRRGA